MKSADFFEEAQKEERKAEKPAKIIQVQPENEYSPVLKKQETEDYIGNVGNVFGGVFNKDLFDDIRKKTTKTAAPFISKIAQDVEKKANIKLPEELTDAQKFEKHQDYFFSDENLNKIKNQANQAIEHTKTQMERGGWMTPEGIKQNVQFMIKDTVQFTTAMRDNFQSMMEVYTKMNAVMEIVK